MNVQETKEQLIAELIRLAFAEDIGDGDHTTLCCIPATEMGKSQLIVKEDGVLAGVEMAERIFPHIRSGSENDDHHPRRSRSEERRYRFRSRR